MASTDYPEDGITNPIPNEEEPLLGPNGSVTQKDTTPIYYNFLTGWFFVFKLVRHEFLRLDLAAGTAVVAQAGIWVVSLHPHLVMRLLISAVSCSLSSGLLCSLTT